MTQNAELTPDATDAEREAYWNAYYASTRTSIRPLPSQFATFVAGELAGPSRVVEFGSGAGRDSLFFSSNGHDVTGVDASKAAVDSCATLAMSLGDNATFIAAAIDEPDLVSKIRVEPGNTLIYARFFIHAITEEEENAFFDVAAGLTAPGDRLAVEYRTVRDSSNVKVTDTHYRRFVSPSEFNAKAVLRDFDVTYAVEGFGFAKYQQDDAYVARALFVKH